MTDNKAICNIISTFGYTHTSNEMKTVLCRQIGNDGLVALGNSVIEFVADMLTFKDESDEELQLHNTSILKELTRDELLLAVMNIPKLGNVLEGWAGDLPKHLGRDLIEQVGSLVNSSKLKNTFYQL